MTSENAANGTARRIALVVAYDGTDYAGFQSQVGTPTIQNELEKAIARLTGTPIRVRGASRTDAGAHACGQVVDFATESELAASVFVRALNYYLPEAIRVLSACDIRRCAFIRGTTLRNGNTGTASSTGKSPRRSCVGPTTWKPRRWNWPTSREPRPACWGSGIFAEYRRLTRPTAARYARFSGGRQTAIRASRTLSPSTAPPMDSCAIKSGALMRYWSKSEKGNSRFTPWRKHWQDAHQANTGFAPYPPKDCA